MLEKVEDGEFISRHDIRVGTAYHFFPGSLQRSFEYFADGGIRRAIRTLAGNLKSLCDTGVLLGLSIGGGSSGHGGGGGRIESLGVVEVGKIKV